MPIRRAPTPSAAEARRHRRGRARRTLAGVVAMMGLAGVIGGRAAVAADPVATTASATVSASASAAPGALDRQARTWAASCASCHGTEGRAAPGMTALVGQPRAALRAQMLAFQSGRVPSTIMQQIARGYTDEQIDRIAAYFAGLPAVVRPGAVGNGN